ncbi:MAG: HEAT repeat domain-containing protein [Blastopirellula sp. JB062]
MLALRSLTILMFVGLSSAGCLVARETVTPVSSKQSGVSDSYAEFDELLEVAANSTEGKNEERSHKKPADFAISTAERRLQTAIQLPSKSGLRGKLVETDGWRLTDVDRRFLAPFFRKPHWRHRNLDTVLGQDDAAELLHAASQSERPLIQATATIGLARCDQVDTKTLVSAVRDHDLPASIRSAALEALALADEQAEIDRLYETREAWIRVQNQSSAADMDAEKLETELIYALGLRSQARSDPRIKIALASASNSVRAAALDAMYLDWQGETPEEAAQLCDDPSRLVAAAARRTAASGDELRRMMGSPTMSLRRDAIYGLAREGSPDSLQALTKVDENAPIVSLLAAIDVWLLQSDFRQIADLAGHSEYRVRSAIAERLTADQRQELRAIVPQLLSDASPQVREQTLASIDSWPSRQATEAMLTALRLSESNYARKEIVAQLASRLQAASLQADETVEAAIVRFEQAWQLQFGTQSADIVSSNKEGETREIAVEMLQLVRKYEEAKTGEEAAAYRQQLVGRKDALLTTLDQLAPELRDVPMSRLCDLVLPELDGDFALGNQAIEEEGPRRLSALRELSQRSKKRRLNQFLLERLIETSRLDGSEEEMHALLGIVQTDNRPAAARLVGLTLHHRAATIRRLSVAWCQRFTTYDYSGMLSTMLEDKERGVRLATAVALRYYPAGSTTDALLAAIGDDDAELAVAAAGSLAYLHVPEGIDALNRFSRDRIERTRRLAAQAMGESGEESLAPTLIRLLGDAQSVRHAALIALPQVVGEDIAAREKGYRDAYSQIAAWQSWYAEQTGANAETIRR